MLMICAGGGCLGETGALTVYCLTSLLGRSLAHGVSRGARTALECAPRLTPGANWAGESSSRKTVIFHAVKALVFRPREYVLFSLRKSIPSLTVRVRQVAYFISFQQNPDRQGGDTATNRASYQ